MTNDAKLQRHRRTEWFGLVSQYVLASCFITGAALVAFMGKLYAAAALLALLQPDEKRILGFSTISCAGLAMALISLANLQAIYAAVLLTLLHGLTKALLLFGKRQRKNGISRI